jgi:hypothetical protein
MPTGWSGWWSRVTVNSSFRMFPLLVGSKNGGEIFGS